ncbi:MAG: LCP family protein, partial [Anaerolineales bacterium]
MPKIDFQRFPLLQIVFWGGVLVMAASLFNFARDFTVCWQMTSLPGVRPGSCGSKTVSPLEGPVIVGATKIPRATATPQAPQEAEYPTWDGAARINILFVGLRGGEPTEADCPICTDTLILLTLDPVTKTAGMLSIPRDMWVNIPGFGYSRINTAWTLGRGSRLPGGGPGLTMKTVSHFIGVPVDY